MLVTSIDKVIKVLPGMVLFISLLFLVGASIPRVLIAIALFVLFYELFRKFPLKNNWFLVPLVSEIIIALSVIFLMTTASFYDALAIFMGDCGTNTGAEGC
ncbi:hypothetical protein [Vulcanisaeta souniana]|uniref:hypothetical protein n=1 Tax=Vulcanisaeta souniana TaxID=164452 RepID=UPI000B0579C4|nr:hypothetical protein [Vulcanisaeta souniana]